MRATSSGARAVERARQLAQRSCLASSAALGLLLAAGCASSGIKTLGAEAPAGAAPKGPAVTSAASREKRVSPRASEAQPRFVDPERRAKIEAVVTELRPGFERELRELGAPGHAWGLVVDDALLAWGVGGNTSLEGGAPVTRETAFRLGSITKVFTSLAILQLRDRGALALDAPMATWLPELGEVVYPAADAPEITLRHVMTHRSGLPRLGKFDHTSPTHAPSEQEVLAGLEGLELDFVPGTDRSYSNFGAALLGLVVARVGGQPYPDYVRAHVLEPLGMQASRFDAEGYAPGALARPHAKRKDALEVVPEWLLGASAGAGGLYSSLDDFSRFVAFQLAAWPPSNAAESPVLARSSLRESQTMQSPHRLTLRSAGNDASAEVAGSGLGWSTQRDCRFEHVVWHNGGTEGHSAATYLLPTRGVGVIVLTNLAEAKVEPVAYGLLERLHDAGVLPEREAPLLLPRDWVETVEATLALGPRFDEAALARLFRPSLLALMPSERWRQFFEGMHQGLGQCRAGAPLGSDRGLLTAALECERGEPMVVRAALGSNQQLGAFAVTSRERYEAQAAQRGRADTTDACGRSRQAPTAAPSSR